MNFMIDQSQIISKMKTKLNNEYEIILVAEISSLFQAYPSIIVLPFKA